MTRPNFRTIYFLIAISTLLINSCSEDSDEMPDDEDTFSASISISTGSSQIRENEGSVEFTISLSEANTSGAAISISLNTSGSATEGADFEIASGAIMIEDGESQTSVQITIIDDTEVEEAETISVSIAQNSLPAEVTIGQGTATISIEDNDESADNNEELGDEEIVVSFSSSTGNTISISEWTDVTNAEGYIMVISDDDSFNELSEASISTASTTYRGYGNQIVFSGGNPGSFTVTLLQESSNYYFKVIPYSGTTYDNSKASMVTSTSNCSTASTTESEFCIEIDSNAGLRLLTSNQLPNHSTGRFPNAEVTATSLSQQMPLSPEVTGNTILVYNESGGPTPRNPNFYRFGVASNGLGYNPMGLKPWTNPDTGEENWEWQAAVVNKGDTDLDDVGGHVTSAGVYHYHGDITGLADEDGSSHSRIYGWAADGFPIYYKYGYASANDASSSIVELKSSYQLRSGDRGGDGASAPDGSYDGTYIQDYEYMTGVGDLDECNGRTGVTPEFPDGTYYYVVTSDFPKVPNCFMGTPDEGFVIGN